MSRTPGCHRLRSERCSRRSRWRGQSPEVEIDPLRHSAEAGKRNDRFNISCPRIGGCEVFLRAGEYDDGTLGESFIDLAKDGPTLTRRTGIVRRCCLKGRSARCSPLDEFVATFRQTTTS